MPPEPKDPALIRVYHGASAWLCYTGRETQQEGGALEADELVQEVVDELSERQAEDIAVIDVSKVAGFADRFVLGTVLSERQMNAVIDSLDERLARQGVHIRRREGEPNSGWVLLDLSDVIVHLFGPEERGFYNLEGLWGKIAPVVRFQ